MKTIIRGRDSGKAKELFQLAREQDAYIVSQNKRALQVKADSLGYNDIAIIDYEDLDNETHEGKVLIHNADKWLKTVFYNTFGVEVIGFSATEE